MATRSRPRIYLAGPEVFLPDPIAAARLKVALCGEFGLEGLFPLDAALDFSGLTKHQQAARIAAANEGLMRSADAVVANLTPFRGVSMDSGTAFEVGFMRALGRPVFWLFERLGGLCRSARGCSGLAGPHLRIATRADIEIEDFDLAENLMITEAITASGGEIVRLSALMEDLEAFQQCLLQVQKHFKLGVDR